MFASKLWSSVVSNRIAFCRADNLSQIGLVNLETLNRDKPWLCRNFSYFFYFESRAIAVKTARCRLKLRYVSKFLGSSRGSPCDSRAQLNSSLLKHGSRMAKRDTVNKKFCFWSRMDLLSLMWCWLSMWGADLCRMKLQLYTVVLSSTFG